MIFFFLGSYAFGARLRIKSTNAECGNSTLPIIFIFFLPSFCLLSSFILRVTSPPYYLFYILFKWTNKIKHRTQRAVTFFRIADSVSRATTLVPLDPTHA